MSTILKVEAELPPLHVKVKENKIGIVVAQWNSEITNKLSEKAKSTLIKAGIKEENILVHKVPGAFELPHGAQLLIEMAKVDAVICIGCLVKGETPHFHYISETVTIHIGQLALRYNRPVSYGVLTVDTLDQAKERTGGKHGNKGEEAALAVLQMLSMKESLRKEKSKSQIGFGSSDEV